MFTEYFKPVERNMYTKSIYTIPNVFNDPAYVKFQVDIYRNHLKTKKHIQPKENQNPFYYHHPYLLPQTTNKIHTPLTLPTTKATTTTAEEQKSNTLFNQTRSKKSSDNLSVRHFKTRMRTEPEEYAEENDRKEFSSSI